jgi:hypothetical protein
MGGKKPAATIFGPKFTLFNSRYQPIFPASSEMQTARILATTTGLIE